MEITSPEQLHAYLMVLKDAGVSRAKLGCVEVEFTAPEAEPVAQPSIDIAMPRVFGTLPRATDAAVRHPGYSALFGENVPKFTPAKAE